MMSRLRKEYPSNLEVYVTNRQGIVECSSDRSTVGIDVSMRQLVKEAVAGTEFFIGGQTLLQTKRQIVLLPSAPYRDAETGAVVGAVIALLDLGWLDDYLAAKPLPSFSMLTMADRNGLIIAQVPKGTEAVGTELPHRLLELLRRDDGNVEKIVADD